MGGSWRQLAPIIAVGCTKIALGGDVEAYAFRDDGWKERLQDFGAGLIMMAVLLVLRRVGAELAGIVTDIMQQCCDDEFVRGTILLGQPCTLEHVLGQCHRLPEIVFRPTSLEYIGNERNDGFGVEFGLGHLVFSLCSSSIASRVDSSPSLSA